MKKHYSYETDFGPVYLVEANDVLVGLHVGDQRALGPVPDSREEDSPLLRQVLHQLQEYFAGKRTMFDLPLAPQGTDFQKRVWQALCDIPYGETCSYGALAKTLGKPGAARAVGMANNKNPIGIIIPCHRVIGANGALVGYAGGLPLKQRLLTLEKTNKNTGTLLHPHGPSA